MRWSAFILVILLVVTMGIASGDEVGIWINGQDITPSFAGRQSQHTDGTVMVPLRVVADLLGVALEWLPTEGRVVATRGERVLSLHIGDSTAMLNGAAVDVGSLIEQIDGTTIVPLRFIATTLADGIRWNDTTKTVEIIDGGAKLPSTLNDITEETTIIIRSKDGRTRSGILLYTSGLLLGVTDEHGVIRVEEPLKGYYLGEMMLDRSLVKSGFQVENGEAIILIHDSFFGVDHELTDEPPTNYSTPIIPPDKASEVIRKTTVGIRYNPSVPQDVQVYIDRLVRDIDPAIRLFVGEPIQDRVFALSYDPERHVGWGDDDKSILWMNKLPGFAGENDRQWDEWFTINYIHQFLFGRSIPIPGTRYNENLAHPIKDVIALYLAQYGSRDMVVSSVRSVEASVQSNRLFETLGASILLNQGSSDISRPGGAHNFLWETASYDKINAFTIDYAKSVWMTLVQARLERNGTLDFFRALQASMDTHNPQTALEFYALIDAIVPDIHGMRASEWLKNTALFEGQVSEGVTFRLLPVRGSFRNIEGESNPSVIYPLVVSRSPGRMLEMPVTISVLDDRGKVVLSELILSGFEEDAWEPRGVPIPASLKPGRYHVMGETAIEGKRFDAMASFMVTGFSNSDYGFGEYILKPPSYIRSGRRTTIRMEYDSSITSEVQEYLKQLISVIDPAIRLFAGAPIDDQVLKVKHDPHGLAGMNGNMTVLNLKRLPSLMNAVDTSFDSFFFIEYYHMFHKGRTIPVRSARYNETISQAMKIVISHYLRQAGLRDTCDKPIPYYIRLGPMLEHLGPGILQNHGIANGNPGESLPAEWKWDDNEPGQQMMNVFTLDYALTPWLKLADAAYRQSGEYDFFVRLLDALYTEEQDGEEGFYGMIDRLVGTQVDGAIPSQWLKQTAAFRGVDGPGVFAGILPIQGSFGSIRGVNNPDFFYPVVVVRDPFAHLWLGPGNISVRDSEGRLVYTAELSLELEHTESGDTVRGMVVPRGRLLPGHHTVTLTLSINGQGVVAERGFYVFQDS